MPGPKDTAGTEPALHQAMFVLAVGALLSLSVLAVTPVRIYAILVAGCAVGVAIVIYPLLGLVIAFLLSGLSQLAVLVPDYFSFSKLAALFSAIGYLIRSTAVRDLRRAWKSRALVTYALPATWFSLSAPLGEASIDAKLSRLYNMAAVIALAFLVCFIPRDIKETRRAILAIVLGCGILGLWVAFFGASGLTAELHEEVEGVTVYYDHNFGIQLGLALCLSWALLEGVSRAWSIAVLAVDVLIVICVLLTHSRTAWIGLVVSGGFSLLWLALRGNFMRVGKFAFAIAAVAITALLLLRLDFLAPVLDLVMPRIGTLSDPTATSSGRLESLWPEAITIIQDHPFIGGGLAGYAHYGVAHNAILEAGVEGGLIGILLYLVSVRYTVLGAVRSKNLWLRVCGIAIGMFVVIVAQTNPSTFYSIPYGFAVGFVAWIEIHDVAPTNM